MITFSDRAKQRVIDFMAANKDDKYLRVLIAGQGAKEFHYQFFLDREKRPDDVEWKIDDFRVLTDPKSAENLKGAEIDWAESASGAGFKVENPNKPQNNLSSPIAQRVQELIENEINPGVSSHGGYIELIDVKDEKAFVKMGGGCQGCGMAMATLKQGVETRIREMVPEIKEVVDVTNHAGGDKPYYSQGQ